MEKIIENVTNNDIKDGYYAIPDGVTEIGSSAFSGCKSLSSITIPDSVTKIGIGAFYECSSLKSITIPDGVTGIGDFAFKRCSSLKSINIPDGVTCIGYCLFDGCSSLESIVIPDGVKKIGDGAFEGCKSLRSISLPKNVKLGKHVFAGCSIALKIEYRCFDREGIENMNVRVRQSIGRLKRDVSKKPARQMTIAEKFFRRSRGEKMWKLDE